MAGKDSTIKKSFSSNSPRQNPSSDEAKGNNENPVAATIEGGSSSGENMGMVNLPVVDERATGGSRRHKYAKLVSFSVAVAKAMKDSVAVALAMRDEVHDHPNGVGGGSSSSTSEADHLLTCPLCQTQLPTWRSLINHTRVLHPHEDLPQVFPPLAPQLSPLGEGDSESEEEEGSEDMSEECSEEMNEEKGSSPIPGLQMEGMEHNDDAAQEEEVKASDEEKNEVLYSVALENDAGCDAKMIGFDLNEPAVGEVEGIEAGEKETGKKGSPPTHQGLEGLHVNQQMLQGEKKYPSNSALVETEIEVVEPSAIKETEADSSTLEKNDDVKSIVEENDYVHSSASETNEVESLAKEKYGDAKIIHNFDLNQIPANDDDKEKP